MNPSKHKEHLAWRPRVNSEHEFNPFQSVNGSDTRRRTLEEVEELMHESEAREDEAEPIKIRGD